MTKIAIVTGGASGIGRALCLQLAHAGTYVVVADLNLDAAQACASLIQSRGGKAEAARLDVTDADGFATLVQQVAHEHGQLDYMFNNAGIAIGGEAEHHSLADWSKILDVDLRGVVNGVVAAYPIMIKQGFGAIVNTASIAGLTPAPGLVPYAAAKHGVVGLSTSLRAEAVRHGVQVNVACPGVINTPLAHDIEMRTGESTSHSPALPFEGVAPDVCAREILRGVANNVGVIVVTRHARAMHRGYRLLPGLYGWMVKQGLRHMKTRLSGS